MKLNLSTKKSKLIILIALFVVFAISGGYLLWRVNQPEELAPGYTDAAWDPGCTIVGDCYEVAGECVGNCSDGAWDYCDTCGVSDDPDDCSERVASDIGKAVGSRCIGKGSYTYECGAWCYLQSNGASCCASPPPPPPTPSSYTITYYPNGGTCTRSSESVAHGGGSLGPGTCTRPGYTVDYYRKQLVPCCAQGYSRSSGTCPEVICDFNVVVEWKAETYTVTYDGNGGTCTPASRSVSGGQNSEAPTCSRVGHTLGGFSRTSGSGGNLNSSTGAVSSVMGNQTIRADWEIKTYTLSYSAGDNGTLEGNTSQTVNHGSSGTVVTAKPDEGYFFGGWSDGKAENPRTDTNVTSSSTVTATFSLSCGDGTCGADENAQNCPTDCDPQCGDGYCTHDETVLTCPEDCEANCGDGYCTHDETNETCPEDCSADCGDDYCDPETETAANCPDDCDADCGDGFCTHDETPETCPEDCGPAATSIPETGIFDEVHTSVLVGFALLLLGFTWRILGRGIYISISVLGRFPRKVSIHLKDIQQERRLKQDIKRKQKFEKKVKKVVKES
jgi:hypothetical protein